jgi:hypothetical protein
VRPRRITPAVRLAMRCRLVGMPGTDLVVSLWRMARRGDLARLLGRAMLHWPVAGVA